MNIKRARQYLGPEMGDAHFRGIPGGFPQKGNIDDVIQADEIKPINK